MSPDASILALIADLYAQVRGQQELIEQLKQQLANWEKSHEQANGVETPRA